MLGLGASGWGGCRVTGFVWPLLSTFKSLEEGRSGDEGTGFPEVPVESVCFLSGVGWPIGSVETELGLPKRPRFGRDDAAVSRVLGGWLDPSSVVWGMLPEDPKESVRCGSAAGGTIGSVESEVGLPELGCRCGRDDAAAGSRFFWRFLDPSSSAVWGMFGVPPSIVMLGLLVSFKPMKLEILESVRPTWVFGSSLALGFVSIAQFSVD
mmetsp:Transcript_17039/g.19592  ORF Transcript_17039/g.19592 Transcript_17039/m.19592 type:complete len:209 (-) Transcript_17039:910-1536(-)